MLIYKCGYGDCSYLVNDCISNFQYANIIQFYKIQRAN